MPDAETNAVPSTAPAPAADVRLALIGAGAIGRMHMDVLARGGCGTLCGIADPSDSARDLAAQAGVPWFADHRDLLDTVRPDGAIVATPNDSHAPVTLDCIARGVAVLVEKPVADTVEAARTMAAASGAAGVPVLVGHHRRHSPIIRRARAAIRDGMLGRPVSAAVMATFLKGDSYFSAAWRRQAGGGPVLINMIHDIDLLRFLLGEIAEVQAIRSNAVRGFEVEDTAAAVFRMRSGVLATITLSDTAACPWNWDLLSGEWESLAKSEGADSHFITGTEGSLTLPRLTFHSYRGVTGEPGWRSPLGTETLPVEHGSPYVLQLRHFARVIRGEEAPVITAADAARTLAAATAVLTAADRGPQVFADDGLSTRAAAFGERVCL